MSWPDFLATYGELVAGGVFAVAGLLGLAFQLRLWRRAAASRAWPAVEGRVIDSRASVLGFGSAMLLGAIWLLWQGRDGL